MSAVKPMFKAIDFFFHWTGNFGLAILIVTVLVKGLFRARAKRTILPRMRLPLNAVLIATLAASLLVPDTAFAKSADTKRDLKIVVRPKHPSKSKYGRYGFLPGYRQPPPLSEWRDRAPRYGGGDFSEEPFRYWSGGEWRYGWGGPGFYRGRWNGGGFGPCWTQTPIGPMWNCGM
jgi:hypothetical protein